MLDFNALLAFSHTHCVAICAVLVPLNLLLTLRTLVMTVMMRPRAMVQQSAGIAIAAAGLLVLHVASWFIVGVVMLQTFVLVALGAICFLLNLGAIRWAIGEPFNYGRS
jgi:hypothetical protein